MTTLPARLPQPIAPDLVKEIAMDIGKEVAAYVERMYPAAVEAASSTFLLSLRNHTYNQIMAAPETTDEAEIAERLVRRRRDRRKLRAQWKAISKLRVGDAARAEAIIRGDIPMEPDL